MPKKTNYPNAIFVKNTKLLSEEKEIKPKDIFAITVKSLL